MHHATTYSSHTTGLIATALNRSIRSRIKTGAAQMSRPRFVMLYGPHRRLATYSSLPDPYGARVPRKSARSRVTAMGCHGLIGGDAGIHGRQIAHGIPPEPPLRYAPAVLERCPPQLVKPAIALTQGCLQHILHQKRSGVTILRRWRDLRVNRIDF